jgi:hypothetical protein
MPAKVAARADEPASTTAPAAPPSRAAPEAPGVGWVGYPACLSAVVEEIASHGYVVVGLNPAHESTTVFPDGRVVPMNAAAMRPVMGPYAGMSHEQAVAGRAAIVDLKAADMRFVADRVEGLAGGADRLAGRLDGRASLPTSIGARPSGG